uniref:Latent transforming growth factor beta binding protein 2 n=1 Tax=Electrophorus electricus TaxID=8005 RepID=A0A4W4F2N7_ELEEL
MQELVYLFVLCVQIFISHCCSALPFSGANLTAGVDRIKIVFTPMVCRRVCNGQRCYNSCEKGDKTTHGHMGNVCTLTGFAFFCQIPCMNGGRCIGQNECWCPSNSTGKFCHLPAPTPSKPTNSRKVISNRMQNGSSHTMYTLPLSNQQASMLPSLVNVHVQHPPEAKIQIHQVARVKPSQTVDGVHSVQQRSQPGNSHTRDSGSTNGISSEQYNSKNSNAPSLRPHNRLNGYVGRCFQETVDGQCGKPLPGLTKQDDCCGSVGASWGLNKCTECPSKPAYAVIANGQVECPKGYKRMNSTHCQDINECLMPGICKNAECLNTKGSYRCMCKPGYMLDPARSHCVSDKAVSVEKSMCYRSVSVGSCSLPLPLKITKQICCCSRVGKAWGSTCERCPLPDTDHFKEICPAGHGYTYSHSDVQITLRELEAEELQRVESFLSQVPTYHQPAPTLPETLHHLPPVPVSPKTPYIQAQVPTWPQLPKSPQPGQPPRTAQLPHPPQTVSQAQTQVKPSLLAPYAACQHPFKCLLADIDKCSLTPTICGPGQCVSVQTGYTCYCDPGYKLNALQTTCIDINECQTVGMCANGQCVNTEGSFTCTCNHGYQTTPHNNSCHDVDECAEPSLCRAGVCVNTVGSFSCTQCEAGYTLSQDRQRCEGESGSIHSTIHVPFSFTCLVCRFNFSESNLFLTDINECLSLYMCPNGICLNSEGSFSCYNCPTGYNVSADGELCEDIDECESPEVCPLAGCTNTAGSYSCMTCDYGYMLSSDRSTCEDVDECAEATTCSNGECMNTEGSYKCLCDSGYKFSTDSRDCEDLDECKEYSDACGAWNCENTLGSYRCFVGCQSGFYGEDNKDCDINECEDETICGKHGYCENTDGSYRCQCDQGYTNPPEGQGCIDINECERSTALCGEALCENVEGSFLCLCPSEDEEFDPITNQCRPRSINLPAVFDEDQRKECYYNLNDANLCENVLSRNVTKQECCCTVGAGWGDDCEIHPCPQKGQVEYDWLCPHGSGILSVISSVQGFTQLQLQDADECEMFGSEICKNGHCLNLYSSYSCLCHDGYYYDSIRMECVDYDECKEENLCEHGTCVNTDGSFNCFCSPPLILDNTQRRCISVNNVHVVDDGVHTHTCWKELKHDSTCSSPMIGIWTTYTECCCLYGVAWGSHCAFCPDKFTEDFAMLCNLPQRSSDSLRETPGFEYGPDASPDGLYSNANSKFMSLDQNEGFEGLRAEECGILNGCENGRCVRVQEGYTCDCFDGYELDLSKMACVDINECEDISDKVELCKNGVCTNTDGSYKCTCLPVHSIFYLTKTLKLQKNLINLVDLQILVQMLL